MQANHRDSSQSFELKSGQFTFPNLRLLNANMEQLTDQLEKQVNQSPAFFINTPVVIDLSALAETNTEVNFAWLVGLMRGHGMIPIGVKGGSKQQQEMAELMELAVLSVQKGSIQKKVEQSVRKPPPAISNTAINKMVTTPVRSGQRIFASEGDLIITSSVSSGAEVIAVGNIHIYGALRGRALAGVKGDRNARIFCHNLQAELIAIAGQYLVNESLDASCMNKPVQVYLADKKLKISTLSF